WHYDEEHGFLLHEGRPLIDALRAATQPEATGRRYDFSCYRATEYVILLGIGTLGAAGASWAEAGEAHHEPGRAVPAVVDTTGAGDALVGALAALLAEGAGLGEATRIAAEAAAISVTREGAQASYARRAEVTARL
ncbi:MAG: ribokinase, partial [Actinobacteria bacterium]|nr:ribokinase [Actinomycetota bacterium]